MITLSVFMLILPCCCNACSDAMHFALQHAAFALRGLGLATAVPVAFCRAVGSLRHSSFIPTAHAQTNHHPVSKAFMMVFNAAKRNMHQVKHAKGNVDEEVVICMFLTDSTDILNQYKLRSFHAALGSRWAAAGSGGLLTTDGC